MGMLESWNVESWNVGKLANLTAKDWNIGF
jgi:hypothetical protein